jgi:hypothetical protein
MSQQTRQALEEMRALLRLRELREKAAAQAQQRAHDLMQNAQSALVRAEADLEELKGRRLAALFDQTSIDTTQMHCHPYVHAMIVWRDAQIEKAEDEVLAQRNTVNLAMRDFDRLSAEWKQSRRQLESISTLTQKAVYKHRASVEANELNDF